MNRLCDSTSDRLWERLNGEFRDPAEILGYWQELGRIDPRTLVSHAEGAWWDILEELDICLLVTREYEHLLVALACDETDGPSVSLMRMPHPSGIAVDRGRGVVHVACTRNPNQIYDLVPVSSLMDRADIGQRAVESRVLIPIRTRFFPGCLYIHELAVLGDKLFANSVGQNAIVWLQESGEHQRIWWPKCVETPQGVMFGQNHLQLNSIAAGADLESSFFSASTDEITEVKPGNPEFPVDRRGVIFSGASREPIARGLTRPHSARLHEQRLWVDNSGYGEMGYIERDHFEPVVRLSGWTRGLCFLDRIAFVGTSRVLPRFHSYAPGVDVESSICGVHAVDTGSGELLGSLFWPHGNQIFSIEPIPRSFSDGLPFSPRTPQPDERTRQLFYGFEFPQSQEE